MADMTATTVATWMPAVWSAKPTVTYRSNVVNVPLMDHTWEPELGVGRGNRVNIPGFTQNTGAANRGAGTGTFGTGAALTFTANTESQLTLTVNRFYYMAFRDPVEIAPQVMSQYLTLLLKGHGEAIALQVDSDIASDDTNGYDGSATVVGTDNVDLTEDDLLTIETDLNNQNAPVKDRFGVISPATRASLLKIESVRNQMYRDTIGNLPGDKGAGFLGKVLTFDIYMSNNLETGTTGKKNCFFQREARAYAEQVSIKAEKAFNMEDGAFNQYMSYMTCGFLEIKDLFSVEVAGK